MCSNCYNGCTDITSDQCVRYTGVDVSVLGIKNGDSLSFVEQAIITFLTSTLDGTGIKPNIPSEIICATVQSFLPTCQDITEVDLFKALIQSVCSLETQIVAIQSQLTTLNSSYTTSCLTGVISSDTHGILQTVINNLCSTNTALAALALNVSTNYVALADLNGLIAAYLASIAPSANYSNRMVPYAVQEYYGPLSNFDASGAGIGLFSRIFLCNGNNGTPDKRGRVAVGAIAGVPGGTLDPAVNPSSSPFNPNYALNDTIYGVNSVILNTTQIPSHLHGITDPGHFHYIAKDVNLSGSNTPVTSANPAAFAWTLTTEFGDYRLQDAGPATVANVAPTNTVSTGITATNNAGGGAAHDNKQPSIACYYIMYIP